MPELSLHRFAHPPLPTSAMFTPSGRSGRNHSYWFSKPNVFDEQQLEQEEARFRESLNAIRNVKSVPDLLVDGYDVEDEDEDSEIMDNGSDGMGDMSEGEDGQLLQSGSMDNSPLNNHITSNAMLLVSPPDGIDFATNDAAFLAETPPQDGMLQRGRRESSPLSFPSRFSFGTLSPIPPDLTPILRHQHGQQGQQDSMILLDEYQTGSEERNIAEDISFEGE